MDHRHGLNRPQNRGFTLIEVMVVCLMLSLISGIIYQMFTGTFSGYLKSQAKFTNLRAASVILEYIKYDIRRAAIPLNPSQQHKIEKSAGGLKFSFQIMHEQKFKRVTYSYENDLITRSIDGAADRTISQAKVASFTIDEGVAGTNKFIQVSIVVDEDLDDSKRNASSMGNKVRMGAILYPRFFGNFSSVEEEYWALARKF